ncbi:Choline transport ATP-binding protein OpuBA [Collinsella sp. AK_207A]|uniref:ABC transporter ATP-binding protein n=1 Tax=Collinsella sp. AK_207A TaxID=2650472 RepID=UPI0012612457|nr:ATP-binding cassette domain-containing protein [Collinsella sp. AK_207A]VWL89602.1 Choline transport ATP-binding protein OpuBA [Collinsella sp. AK_207A]
MSTAVEFKDVSKSFPGMSHPALDHVSLKIEEGELVCVLGTSGGGKTTLIKLINRLHDPDAGQVLVEGRDVAQADPVELRRGIGYVIQQTGLFPHMTVAENIACVPEILKWDRARITARVDELLNLVGLDPVEFKDRYPRQLSGGQQQRVGLARALAANPSLMLFDEPFGAIDAITRATLQDELLRIHRGSGKTFIFVTHDIAEALKLGTKVLVLDQGRVQQYGTPREVLESPATPFVRALLESGGWLERRGYVTGGAAI